VPLPETTPARVRWSTLGYVEKVRRQFLSLHPDSGIFLLRKRVPERLKAAVGKREIKLSLRTRDPVIARIRHLELLAKIEREFAGIDAAIVGGDRNVVVTNRGLRLCLGFRELHVPTLCLSGGRARPDVIVAAEFAL
jgi:hypothetical protein